MKLTGQVSLLLLLMSGAVVFVASVPQRSARWDAFLHHSRQKRSANTWQAGGRSATCTLQNLTADDTLQQRTSGLLSPPQDQGCCGSCWAFAATHTYTDHLSIRAGSRQDQLSAQYLTACISNNRQPTPGTTQSINGCCGDSFVNALWYFYLVGTVTESCVPYSLSDYLTGIAEENEAAHKRANPIECPASCSDGMAFQPNNLRLYGFRSVLETQVITALRTGPVVVNMDVPSRFFDYRCGVFCSDPSDPIVGVHSVEIVDYGTTSSGLDFWVVKNSYGEEWGENGYFRIRRGDPILHSVFVIPVLSTSEPTSTSQSVSTTQTLQFMACAPENVSNPTNNTLIMSAIDVTVMQLNGRIPCRDNSAATSVSLVSVTNATAQIVDGVLFTLNIVVNLQGCMQPTQANVDAVVILYLNGTFELTGYTHQHLVEGGAAAITGNTLLLLVATTIMAVLTFSCY